jgi:hypothetical protein
MVWFIEPKEYDMQAFYRNIGLRLQGNSTEPGFTQMTTAQLDDIITCAGTRDFRGSYAMDFEYTDLKKAKNFIGFESGVICYFPPDILFDIGKDDTYKSIPSVEANKKFKERYGAGIYNCPKHYDPRCQDWYVAQYEKEHTTFTDVQVFPGGKLGITNCVPLWSPLNLKT